MSQHKPFKIIGLAKERESPENPGSMEKRVALIPDDVKKLTKAGCRIFVEYGAGEGVGFKDKQYVKAGAELQSSQELYAGKDLLIKFKGPAMEDIPLMRRGSTLFCMAHFHSFPERARLLEDHKINVVAMEHIVDYPANVTEDMILGRMAADHSLEEFINRNMMRNVHLGVLGYDDSSRELIRRLANHNPASLTLFKPDVYVSSFEHFGGSALYLFDSKKHKFPDYTIDYLKDKQCRLYDVRTFYTEHKKRALDYYKTLHPPASFGLRRIQCLHETGMAGARYGFKLLEEESPLKMKSTEATAIVLGYGNVGMGAIDECYRQGVHAVHILGPAQTQKGVIEKWLEIADVVVNGAEQPAELRGKNFLVTNEHVRTVMKDGAVLIDLIGGSATNLSPVEPVIECTYLTDPHFIQDNVFVAALWGWPMMGMMRETAIRYSGQIAEVLLDKEKLLNGLSELTPGVKPALVCGPFEVT